MKRISGRGHEKISDLSIHDRSREKLQHKGAAAIIIAHNHPAGGLTPSKEDMAVTEQLKAAGETLGIRMLDHIIFNHKGYYSFLEQNEL